MNRKKAKPLFLPVLCLLLSFSCLIGLTACQSVSTPEDPDNPALWEAPIRFDEEPSSVEEEQPTASQVGRQFNRWYNYSKNVGTCGELKGRVMLCLVFVDSPGCVWPAERKEQVRFQAQETIRLLQSEAAMENITLTMSESETSVVAPSEIHWSNVSALDRSCDYVMSLLLTNSGRQTYAAMYQNMLDAYGMDSIAFVLLPFTSGRAFAHNDSITASNHCEHLVLFGEEDYSGLTHELLHLYGAIDYYYPEKVRDEARRIFGESIMLNKGQIDDYAKFLIGWDQTPSPTAQAFLDAISSVTSEEVVQAVSQEWEADYIEKVLDDGSVYKGPIHGGERTGYGTLIYANGSVYEGYFADNTLNGTGRFQDINGSVYEGEFVNGQFSGTGRLTYADGSVYTGSFSNGQRSGKGRLTYPDGAVYEGDFADGKISGKGRLTYTDGTVYEGDFADGAYQGKGRLSYQSGTVYEGDFSNNLFHGKGLLIYANGCYYEGDFANGKCNGKGRLTYRDGSYYEGDFVDDVRQGYGVVVYSNGARYEGWFVNNEPAN